MGDNLCALLIDGLRFMVMAFSLVVWRYIANLKFASVSA